MITRLQAYYGGTPTEWLRTPTGVLNAFASMLPALIAEDCLRSAQVVAVGTSSMDKADRRAILRDWTSEARRGAPEPVLRPTGEQKMAMLEAVGISHG